MQSNNLVVVVQRLSQTNEFRSQGAVIRVSLPAGYLEDIGVRTSNGPMVFNSVNASIMGKITNRAIELTSVSGNVKLETSNAPIVLENCAGVMELKSTNGAFKGNGINGSLVIETSNAPITIEKANVNVSASTSNGLISVVDSVLFGRSNVF